MSVNNLHLQAENKHHSTTLPHHPGCRTNAPHACFVFSTEEALEQDFVLRPTGRYAHSRSYIERLAAANGFVLAASRSIDLRMEGQQAIKGDLFVAHCSQ